MLQGIQCRSTSKTPKRTSWLEHAHMARQAYTDFGKGRHRAALNYGDCISYALAKATGKPLLFKGEDFRRTDIAAALPKEL